MSRLAADQVALCLVRILERLAFVLAEPWNDYPDDLIANSFCHTMVRFVKDGEDCGVEVILSANEAFLTELGTSILGIELEDVNDSMRADALLELGNVVAGELVMMIGGEETAYSLTLPAAVDEARALSGPEWEGSFATTESAVQSEDGYLYVALAASDQLQLVGDA